MEEEGVLKYKKSVPGYHTKWQVGALHPASLGCPEATLAEEYTAYATHPATVVPSRSKEEQKNGRWQEIIVLLLFYFLRP